MNRHPITAEPEHPEEREARDRLKAALEEELGRIRFTGHAQVIRRTHPRGWLRRLEAIWNMELELPVIPLAALAVVLAGTLFFGRIRGASTTVDPLAPDSERVLVYEGNNVYWKDDYERAVASIETENSP
ncbi:hypothetical protein [Paenibacillus sp. GCM10023250]|uniref:hypothetical protein n=1 Tax=Paenibacillus sp. GCM10023250 TaxID=3252648 RepID=UPI00361E68C5